MKKILLPGILFLSIHLYSQAGYVGINTPTPNATLDVKGIASDISKLDGIIAPRLTGDELRAKTYTAAQTGALVYVTAADSAPQNQTLSVTEAGYYYFDGTMWKHFSIFASDLRLVENSNHITMDAGVGSDGTSAGSGFYNIAIGKDALSDPSNAGNFNIAIGNSSLKSAQNGFNVGVGALTGELLTGNSSLNTIIGTQALKSLVTGNDNIALGGFSGVNQISGDNNIFIGTLTAPNISPTASNQLNIGNWIYGDNGLIGIGAPTPSQRLDVANGNLRIRDINSNTGTTSDQLVSADANGILKTVSRNVNAIKTGNTILANDYTIILNGDITLPVADASNQGRILILCGDSSTSRMISGSLQDSGGSYSSFGIGTGNGGRCITVQSTGSVWWITARN